MSLVLPTGSLRAAIAGVLAAARGGRPEAWRAA
jgi:hypothetical protein